MSNIGLDVTANTKLKWSYDRVKEWIRQMRGTLLDRRVHAYQEMYALPHSAFTVADSKVGESFAQGNPCRQQQRPKDSNQNETCDLIHISFHPHSKSDHKTLHGKSVLSIQQFSVGGRNTAN